MLSANIMFSQTTAAQRETLVDRMFEVGLCTLNEVDP
jgi:hypothetical protein